MNSSPVSCHNCFSEKREFYVFLECRHFICLSCCLFMANLQNLTVRCCHRNTKMSQELIETVFEEIQSRKNVKERSELSPQSLYTDLNVRMEQQLARSKKEELMRENEKQQLFHRTRDQDFMESKMLNSLKKIKQQKPVGKNDRKQINNMYDNNKQKNNKKSIRQSSQMNKQFEGLKKSVEFNNTVPQMDIQFDSPTFKQILLRTQVKLKQPILQFNQEDTKQNYQYWKNYDTSKDRILAKLNHHQFKMQKLIKQHYYQ